MYKPENTDGAFYFRLEQHCLQTFECRDGEFYFRLGQHVYKPENADGEFYFRLELQFGVSLDLQTVPY